jgi:hypothetical protein
MTDVATVRLRETQVTLGAGAAVVGALLAAVVNLAHGDLPADPETALALVAASPNWSLLHLGIMASILLILGGLVGLSEVAEGPLARALARLSVAAALPGAAVMLVGIGIDGFATKELADLWAGAAGPDKAAAFRMAVSVEAVQNALFHTWAACFIGLPFLLIGLSGMAAGGGFPRWLGTVAVVGGAGALCTGIAGFLRVPVPGALFNVAALVVTLWAFAAGVLAWSRRGRPATAMADGADPPRDESHFRSSSGLEAAARTVAR